MKKTAFPLVAFLIPILALAAADAPSTDAVEDEFRACMINATPQKSCFESTLAKYLPPKNDEVKKVAGDIDALFRKWLATEKVFALHRIRSAKSGDLFERRIFLLEDSSGSLALVQFSTIRQLGKLYVLDFRFNSSREQVEQLLYQK